MPNTNPKHKYTRFAQIYLDTNDPALALRECGLTAYTKKSILENPRVIDAIEVLQVEQMHETTQRKMGLLMDKIPGAVQQVLETALDHMIETKGYNSYAAKNVLEAVDRISKITGLGSKDHDDNDQRLGSPVSVIVEQIRSMSPEQLRQMADRRERDIEVKQSHAQIAKSPTNHSDTDNDAKDADNATNDKTDI